MIAASFLGHGIACLRLAQNSFIDPRGSTCLRLPSVAAMNAIMIRDIIATSMDQKQAGERLTKERQHRQALAERLRRVEAEPVESGELSKIDQHPGELGTETFERERDLTALTILESELEDIETALRRLDEGQYGSCEVCGKAIGDERLDAKPWARFCILHQAEMERAVSRR